MLWEHSKERHTSSESGVVLDEVNIDVKRHQMDQYQLSEIIIFPSLICPSMYFDSNVDVICGYPQARRCRRHCWRPLCVLSDSVVRWSSFKIVHLWLLDQSIFFQTSSSSPFRLFHQDLLDQFIFSFLTSPTSLSTQVQVVFQTCLSFPSIPVYLCQCNLMLAWCVPTLFLSQRTRISIIQSSGHILSPGTKQWDEFVVMFWTATSTRISRHSKHRKNHSEYTLDQDDWPKYQIRSTWNNSLPEW